MVLKRSDGSVSYEGHVLADGKTFHGRGVRYFAGGGDYDGEWSIGSMHGTGIWTNKDKTRFEGEFVYGWPRCGDQTEADGKRYRAEYDGRTNLLDGWAAARREVCPPYRPRRTQPQCQSNVVCIVTLERILL